MMSRTNSMPIAQPARQRGVVLVIALIFMVVLTILGLSASGTSSIESLMAASYRDRDRAFAAAEVALRDAEIRVSGFWTYPAAPVDQNGFPDDHVTECNTDGLCSRGVAQPVYAADFFASGHPSTCLSWGTDADCENEGSRSDRSADSRTPYIPGLANQPRHLIERVCREVPGDSVTGPTCQFVFRVTTQATGAKATTRVTLQEVFVP